ncbi:MAG TPA: transposase [Solirubrobacter sp.]|nr:transposase [Solirubrobacter sp.]
MLHREGGRLFADELFADLFCEVGRRSVPPSIVAVVMVLQRVEGCSDREAVDRFAYDLRWKYAAGGLDFDYPGFVHTVLVDMRARLAASERPDRIFEVVLEVCRRAGLVGRRRVLDSTALYDAVATMDTVTLVRSAIRGLLAVCERDLECELRELLARDDDYRAAGKPVCDYEDPAAREALIDALAKDAHALLEGLEGRDLDDGVAQAMMLLATVVGQDLQRGSDGRFVIVRGVAKDRVISTVDPEARHGHKTRRRGFDGYKGHVAIDPDSEIITNTTVTAGNIADGVAALDLLAEELADASAEASGDGDGLIGSRLEVYGDSSYGAGSVLEALADADAIVMCKVQTPNAVGGETVRRSVYEAVATGC